MPVEVAAQIREPSGDWSTAQHSRGTAAVERSITTPSQLYTDISDSDVVGTEKKVDGPAIGAGRFDSEVAPDGDEFNVWPARSELPPVVVRGEVPEPQPLTETKATAIPRRMTLRRITCVAPVLRHSDGKPFGSREAERPIPPAIRWPRARQRCRPIDAGVEGAGFSHPYIRGGGAYVASQLSAPLRLSAR